MFIFKILKAVSLFYGFLFIFGSETSDITTGELCIRLLSGLVLFTLGWAFTAYERATAKNDGRMKR